MGDLRNNILIKKSSGETEPFSEEKLRTSLKKVDASPEISEIIVKKVKKSLRPGMNTSQIYRHAFSLLRKQKYPLAARYSLKKALMELGPSGHPFEKLVGDLLIEEGFKIKLNNIVQGFCVSHEIDVEAEKNDLHSIIECKFHNQPGIKSDVKVALYVYARFLDIEKSWKRDPQKIKKNNEAWIVTNTKFSSDAIRYVKCTGMKAIGWSYPEHDSLENKIDRSGLHPITCLSTLTNFHKKRLLEKGIVLCKELLNKKEQLYFLKLSKEKIDAVINEIYHLCLSSYQKKSIDLT
ncbi:MAG: ATP cone domain-containing protein [Parachlamydiales bacterium]|jgi:hypothetical protein